MGTRSIFLIFSFLQALSLGFIVYFLLSASGTLGLDTRFVLSSVFAISTWIIQYITHLNLVR